MARFRECAIAIYDDDQPANRAIAQSRNRAMRKGLPERAKMRHDAHFVDELVRRSSSHIGAFIPLDLIDANPEQPRSQMGNLDELTASVREKGVLEPILVRATADGRYQIISGERRYHAATAAGLEEIPAIELDVDDREMLEIALVENIQRKDLTPFEEAEGFHILQERFGYTHEKIAQVIGKSRTTITETLQLNDIPAPIRDACRRAGINNKSVLVQIARAGDEGAMNQVVARFAAGEMNRAELRRETARAETKGAGRPRNYTFTLKDKALPFSLSMTFKRPKVERREIAAALRQVAERLDADG